MSYRQSSHQRRGHIKPSNGVEAEALRTSGIGLNHLAIAVDELSLNTVNQDLLALEDEELRHPTKEVRTKHKVQHTLPNSTTIIDDEVIRIKRVPLEGKELDDYYRKLYSKSKKKPAGKKAPKATTTKKGPKKSDKSKR